MTTEARKKKQNRRQTKCQWGTFSQYPLEL